MFRIVVLGLTAAATLLAIPGAPPPSAAETIEPRQPGARDVCRVCGMFVAPHPEWIAQVVFEDGSAAFFDGSGDLFRYLLDRDRFDPNRRDLEITASFVTSYYDLRILRAESATYVVGSDVLGPMGPELIPHPTRAEAEEFQRDHGGRQIVRFEEVTAQLLETLRPSR